MNNLVLGTVERGQFVPTTPQNMLALNGKQCVLSIYKKKRTSPLNRYYWGVVVRMIADEIGEDDEIVHDLMRYKYLYEVKQIVEEKEKLLKSTTKLNNSEFLEYLSKVKMWASKFLNLYIPDPNEVSYDY